MSEPDRVQVSLQRIHDAAGGEALVTAIWAHYHDNVLARATSRELMYLHIGMLVGALSQALDARQDR